MDFYEPQNSYDTDLKYAFGTIEYTISIVNQGLNEYDITINFEDPYVFINDNKFGSSDNLIVDFGYALQKLGIGNRFVYSYTFNTRRAG